MTSVINLNNMKNEFLVFLRNLDILSTSIRGVTRVTENFSGTGAQYSFVLTNSGVKNVKTVTVATVNQTFGYDYTVNYDTKTVTFITAPPIGTNNISITYDYGSGDKIYPDFPRPDLTLNSFPRIGFDIISMDTKDIGFGNAMASDIDLQVNLYSISRKDLDTYSTTLRTGLINNRNNFFYMNHLIPIGMGKDLPNIGNEDRILQRIINIRSILNYEVN